jgi:hypothetical protein
MTMRRFVTAAVVALIAVAYAAGYWPERQRRVALEAEVASSRIRLAELESRVRAGSLLGELLLVTETVAAMNYGEAQRLSSGFFDGVRQEAARSSIAEVRTALEAIHGRRDSVTGALARGDQTVLDELRRLQVQLRQALGHPVAGP